MAANDVKIVLTAEDKTTGAFNSARKGLGNLAAEAKSVVSGVGAVRAAFGVLGGAVGAALSITAVKGAVDMLDQLDDLSEKTGIATEALSALRYAGEVVGTPIEALATGVRKLSLNMAAAAGGGKEQAAAFQAIGVSFKNLDGSLRGSDQVLGAIADKFASFRDGPEKAALAVELFGKAGADMIPLLNKGSAGMEELRQEAERLGVVFSGDRAAQAAEFNDNLKKIQISAQGFAGVLAGEMVPTLNELAKIFLESSGGAKSFAELLGGGLAKELRNIAIDANNIKTVFEVAGLGLYSLGTRIKALATLDLDGFSAISDAVERDANKAWEEAKAFKARLEGLLTSTAGAGRGTAIDPRILGSVPSIKAQADALKAAAPVVQKLGETAKTTGDELQKLLDKLQGKATGFDADYAKNINLLRTALDTGRLSWDAYTKAVGQYVAQQPASIEATKALTKEIEAAQKAAEERQAQRIKEDAGIEEWVRAQEAAAAASLKSINDRIDGLATEQEAAALATTQNISLAEAIERITVARLQEQQTVLLAGSAAYDNVQKEIDARQKLIGIINTKDLRDKESAGWSQVFASIDSTARDAWTNVWESGSDAFKRIGQTLKAAVLDVLYQMTVRPFIVKIGASIMGGGFATAANAATGSGTGVLGNIGNLSSLVTGGTSFGNFAGTAMANLTGTGLDGLLATNAAFGTAAAEGMGAVMSGLMTAAPYLAGIAAVYAIAKALDKSGTPHTGAGSGYSATGGLMQASRGDAFNSGFTGINYSADTEQMTTGLVQSIVGILDSTATTFGKTAGYQAAASFADDSSKDGAWGSLFLRNMQGVLTDWQAGGVSFRTFSDGSAGSAEYLAAVTADVRAALDQIGLPEWAAQTLDKLGASPSLDQLATAVAEINRTQVALQGLGKVLGGFSDLSDGAVQALIQASGGIDSLASAAATYYDNFYTEAEKTAAVSGSVADALAAVGLQMPATREQFRALVDSQQALGEAGAPALAALLQVSGAFASVVPATEALAVAVDDAATSMDTGADAARALAEAEKAIADERASLMDELWAATNQTAQIRAKQLAGLDAGNRPIQQALFDIADAQTALGALQSSVQAERDRLTRDFEAQKAALQQPGAADFGYLQQSLDAGKKAVADELAIKRKGYAEQIGAAQDARAEMARIADQFTGAMRSVRIEGEAFEQSRLLAARRAIADAALSGNVRAAGLDAAIGVATGTDSARFYATFAQYAIDQAKTAADIGKLAGTAQTQVSAYDQTIAAIQASDALAQSLADAQMAAMQAQYELDLSAAQAEVALAAESNAAQLAALQAQYDLDIAALDKTAADAQAQLDALLGIDTSVQSVTQAVQAFSTAILGAMDSVARVAAQEAAAQTAALIGAAQASSAAALLSNVPQLATGTNRVPRDMLAMLHQGEAIVPAAYNPPPGGSVNAELVAELRALRAEVAELRQSSERSAIEAKRGSDALQGQQRVPILVQVVS